MRPTNNSKESPEPKIKTHNIPITRDRLIWVQPKPIYVPGRYRYIWIDISSTNTDTDIFPKPIFGFVTNKG